MNIKQDDIERYIAERFKEQQQMTNVPGPSVIDAATEPDESQDQAEAITSDEPM